MQVVLSGYNIERFDLPIAYRIMGSILQDFSGFLTADLYTIAMRDYPTHDHQLGELYKSILHKDPVNAHDATADCYMVADLLSYHCAEKEFTPVKLAESLKEPKVLDIMPFGKYKGQHTSTIPRGYWEFCKKKFTDTHKDVACTIDHYLKYS